MFRLIIFVIMLGWVLVLSGCAAIGKGNNIEGEDYKSGSPPRGGYSRTTPHKALVTEACWIEANNLIGDEDFRADDRARRVYFNQCMLKNGYDADGNYVGIPPK
ncbi:MAG: hypothetical protein ACWGOD_06485 [Desulfobulbales bacterium]